MKKTIVELCLPPDPASATPSAAPTRPAAVWNRWHR